MRSALPLPVASLLLGWLTLPFGFALSQESPSPLPTTDSNPALQRFGNAIVLYLSFDGHEFAEILPGPPAPQRDKWEDFLQKVDGKQSEGVLGQGLQTGVYSLNYTSDRSFVLGQTGSVVFWSEGLSLNHRGEYWWPIRLFTPDYMVMAGRMGDPRNREKLYAYMQRGKSGVSTMAGSMEEWKEEWHLWVINWDRNGIELSMDGREPARSPLRDPLPEKAGGGFRLTFNSATDDMIAVDELMVLNMPLKIEEIKWLYDTASVR